jgi:hypothetical protein
MTASPFPFLCFSFPVPCCAASLFFFLTFALYKGIRDTKGRMMSPLSRKSMKASG